MPRVKDELQLTKLCVVRYAW